MAALIVDETFDPRRFYSYASAHLPGYAQPRFLRLVGSVDLTGSFRHKKASLKDEGYGEVVEDPVLLRDPAERCYRPLDAALRRAVDEGEWPL